MRLSSSSSLLATAVAISAFGLGMMAAYALGNNGPKGFFGSFDCENFGLPDKSYSGLRIDRELKVFGTGTNKEPIHIGRLDLRDKDLAMFEFARETLAWRSSPLDPLADYIVDNAGDALLILEMQGDRARMSYVCRRN